MSVDKDRPAAQVATTVAEREALEQQAAVAQAALQVEEVVHPMSASEVVPFPTV